jgi:hypothetical protein
MTTENSQDVTQAAGEARQAAEETEQAAITLAQAIANAKAHFKPLTDAIGNAASFITGLAGKLGGLAGNVLLALPGMRTLYSSVISLGQSFHTAGLLVGHFAADLGNIARNFLSTNSYAQRLAAGMRYVGQSFGVVRDLGVGLNTHLESISAKVNVLTGAVGKAFQTLTGASSVTELVTKVVAANAALGDLSDKTGIATQDLQAWGNIADLSGGKAGDMQQGMAKVAEEMNTLKNGGEKGNALKFFESMGVSVTDATGKLRDQKDLMLDMAGQMQGMSQMDVMAKAKDSGLNESQLAVMMQGRAELQAMLTAQQANSLATEQQAKRAQDLQQAWTLVQQSVGSLSNDFVNDIGPALTLFMDGLRAVFDYLKQHRGLLYGFFIGLAVAMAPAIVASISLAAGVLAATWPLLALGAAIGLVIDWFISWQNGTESTIGSIIGWLGDLLGWFGELAKAMAIDIFAFFKAAATPVIALFKLQAALIGALISAWQSWAASDFSMSSLLDGLGSIANGFSALIDKASLFWDLIKAIFTLDMDAFDSALKKIGQTFKDGMAQDKVAETKAPPSTSPPTTTPLKTSPRDTSKYRQPDTGNNARMPQPPAVGKKQPSAQPVAWSQYAVQSARLLSPAPSANRVAGASGARAQAQLVQQPTQVSNTTTNSTSVHNQFGVINIHAVQDGQRMGNEFVSTVNASLKGKGANPYAFNSA